jgi:hypothetical protein
MSAHFKPETDECKPLKPGPAFVSLLVLTGFAIINRRVAAAVDRRKDREDAEEAFRLARLGGLDGSMDAGGVQAADDALNTAREREVGSKQTRINAYYVEGSTHRLA